MSDAAPVMPSAAASPLAAGAELPVQRYPLTRADLVRYAGASGDRNPIHWSERTALAVGLPGVIAHGMLTLALAARAVAAWTGDAEVLELGSKFTAPVVVPDDDEGVVVEVRGTVKDVAEGRATLALEVTCGGRKVLGQPRAVVRV